MAISTNGTIYARLAGGLYNTVLSNATYLELVAQDPSTVANKLYAADFGKMTDLQVGTTIVANLGLSALTGLDAWVAAQLTAAGAANKGAKIVSMLNDFSAMTADTTYGTYATAYNTKVDAALAASQTTGKAEAKFSAAAPTVTSFTLTTGVDAIVGSAGDDTITAPATVAATGAAQTTINSGDSIDGGAGTDSLTLTITAANNNSLTGLTIKGVENNFLRWFDKTGGALSAETVAGIATDYSVTMSGTPTFAGLKAAAAAALKAADGTATTDATIEARADALAATAQLVDNAADSAADAISHATTGTLVAAYLADANAKAALAGATASLGAVTLAANADATSITIDGTTTTVTGLTDAQTVTMSGAIANTASTAATATVAKVGLSSASGTLTVKGSAPLVTATITGSLKQGTAGTNTGSAPGTITLVDGATTDTIKTLNLGLTNNATLTISDMTAVTAIDGSASTGGLTLSPLATTLNVTTGSGADTVTFAAETDITNAKKLTSALSTGAGNDKITVSVAGSGTSAVNAGAGDDSITMTTAVGTAVVDGGDGKDTLVLRAADIAFGTGSYNNIKANVLNVEVLSFQGAAVVDAAKASQFTEFTFAAAGGSITKVADTQTVNVTAATTASSAGYVAKGGLDANGDTATATAYVGTLTATAKGTTTLTANASAVTLAVSNATSTSNGVTTGATASAVTLTGDAKTASISVGSNVDNSKLATTDVFSSVTVTPTGAQTAGGAFTALGNLTSLTLTGTGSATVNNSTAAVDTRVSKLATIDASGLVGKKTIAGSSLGDATAGLTWTAGTVAETVKLGTALDKLTIGTATTSNYSKMDSITGFTLVGDATGVLTLASAAKSDDISVGGITTFAKAAAGYSATSFDSALNTLANRAGAENVVFQCNGNTYIFVDAVQALTGFDDTADTVVELVGLVDLDNLVLALNGLNVL
jgi:trimeric autotransporter adhesin